MNFKFKKLKIQHLHSPNFSIEKLEMGEVVKSTSISILMNEHHALPKKQSGIEIFL